MHRLPTPVMSATLVRAAPDVDPKSPEYFAPYFKIDVDRDPARSLEARIAVIATPEHARRPSHCTSCGARGHNSRSRKVPRESGGTVKDESVARCLFIVFVTLVVVVSLFLWWLVLAQPMTFMWAVLGSWVLAGAVWLVWRAGLRLDRRREARELQNRIPKAVARERNGK